MGCLAVTVTVFRRRKKKRKKRKKEEEKEEEEEEEEEKRKRKRKKEKKKKRKEKRKKRKAVFQSLHCATVRNPAEIVFTPVSPVGRLSSCPLLDGKCLAQRCFCRVCTKVCASQSHSFNLNVQP